VARPAVQTDAEFAPPLQYDGVVLEMLEGKVTAKASLKGHLDIYRYCDNVSDCALMPHALLVEVQARVGL
jgi:hypothetical protein